MLDICGEKTMGALANIFPAWDVSYNTTLGPENSVILLHSFNYIAVGEGSLGFLPNAGLRDLSRDTRAYPN